MKLVAGLGNPGSEYEGTRHNIGFALVDKIADVLSINFSAGKGKYLLGSGNYKGEKIALMKPMTYMNRSGQAVRHALNWFKIDPSDCLVCYDDLHLPIGTIRSKSRGSAGGHNGLSDIITTLQTDEIPRLRIGIGNDFGPGGQVSYVLSRFSRSESDLMEETLERASNAVLTYVTDGMDEAMNRYN